MATSGTFTYDPQISELLDEAFELAGVAPPAVGNSHIKSAFRSLKLMLNSEWSTLGVRRWMTPQVTQAVSVAMTSFTLPVGALDVLGMILRRDNRDTEMYAISMDEYLKIVDKTIQGRPDRYYVDRTALTKTVKIWQAGENTTDLIVYDYFRQIQDPGTMANTLQIPSYAMNAMVLGLASRLAMKFNLERAAGLVVMYRGPDPNRIGGELDRLRQEDRERSDIEAAADFTGGHSAVR